MSNLRGNHSRSNILSCQNGNKKANKPSRALDKSDATPASKKRKLPGQAIAHADENNFDLSAELDDDLIEVCTQFENTQRSHRLVEAPVPNNIIASLSSLPVVQQHSNQKIVQVAPSIEEVAEEEEFQEDEVEEIVIIDEDQTESGDREPCKVIFSNLILRQDVDDIFCFLNLLCNTISDHNSILFEINDTYQAMLIIANLSLTDPYFKPFAGSLTQFFRLTVSICRRTFDCKNDYLRDDWLNSAISYARSLQTILNSSFESFTPITLGLVTSALASSFILCLNHNQLGHIYLSDLLELYQETLELLFSKLRESSDLSQDVDDLIYIVNKTERYFEYLNNLSTKRVASNETLETIGRIICSHIDYICQTNREREECLTINCFEKIMGNRLVSAITTQLEITKQALFLGLSEEISQRLTDLCINGLPFPTICQCLYFLFEIDHIPGEVIHIMLPRLIILHNEKTTQFFDYFSRASSNDRSIRQLILKERYLIEIVSALFYEAEYSNILLYEVFSYLNNYLQHNLLCDVSEIHLELIKHFLLYYSDNEKASLAGLSFINCLDPRRNNLTLGLFETSLDLNFFQEDKRSFVVFLEQYFLNFCSEFRSKLVSYKGNLWYRKTKGKYLKSFKMLMQLLNQFGDFKKFLVCIYHVIKFLFDQQNHQIDLDHSLDFLSTFIDLAEESFVRSEIASICLMIMPFVKLKPQKCVALYRNLILERPHPIDVIYQLYFVSNLPNAESLTQEIQARIDADRRGLASFKLPIDELRITNHSSEIDHNKLILFLATEAFGRFCQEMLYPLDHLNQSNLALHPVALRKIKRMLTDIACDLEFYLILREETFEEAKDVVIDFGGDRAISMSPGPSNSNSSEATSKLQVLASSIETVGNFFNHLVTTLFRSIKHSSSDCRGIALDCLGTLGAVNANYLGASRPNQASCRFDIMPATPPLINFCHLDHFDPRKKEFKLLLLQILASMVDNTTEDLDYNLIGFGISKLQQEFITGNHDVMQSLFQLQDQTKSISKSMTKAFNFYKKAIVDALDLKFARTRATKEQRAHEERNMLTVLANELDIPVDLKRDLTPAVRDVVITFREDFFFTAPEPKVTNIDIFFDRIRPTMAFAEFVESFVDMLYGCFIYPAKHNDPDNLFESERGPRVEFEQIFSQVPLNQFRNDWDQIYEKLNKLRVPKSVFFIGSYKLTGNCKLQQLLMPSMLILSLGLAEKELLQKFVHRFKTLVLAMIADENYFLAELGPMFVEMLSMLYDYLRLWLNNRSFLHNYLIGQLVLKNRVERFDNEFNGVKMLLEQLPITLMIHLAYLAKSYHRSLFYLETYLEENRLSNSPIVYDSLVQNNLDYFYRIYSALGERESLDALNRCRLTMPTISELFWKAETGNARTDQNISGARLIASDMLSERKRKRSGTSADELGDVKRASFWNDNRQRYVEAVAGLQQDFLHFWREPSDLNVKNLEKHRLANAIELNMWDDVCGDDNVEHNGLNHSTITIAASNQNLPCALIGLHRQLPSVQLDDLINDKVRETMVQSLGAAMLSDSKTAYARAYSTSIVPLHLLKDVDDWREFFRLYLEQQRSSSGEEEANETTDAFNRLLKLWRIRNRLIPQGSGDRLAARVNQKRMVALMQSKYEHKFGKQYCLAIEYFRCLNECVADALAAGELDTAYSNVLEALNLKNSFENNRALKGCFSNDLSHQERTEFVLNTARVFWCRAQPAEAAQIIKIEIDARYQTHQRHYYRELLMDPNIAARLDNIEAVADVLEMPLDFLQAPIGKNWLQNSESNKMFARLQLQHARYCNEARMLDTMPNNLAFMAVVKALPEWEEAHHRLAMFYLQMAREINQIRFSIDSKTKVTGNKAEEHVWMQASAVASFAESLRYDYKFATISLPLMWRAWIGIGEELRMRQSQSSSMKNYGLDYLRRELGRTTAAIQNLEGSTNAAIFFIILDQVIASMNDSWAEIKNVSCSLLVKLISYYRYHMAWQFARLRGETSMSQSATRIVKSKQRAILAKEMIKQAENNPGPYFKMFDDFMVELQKLTSIKSKQIQQSKFIINSVQPSLLRSFEAIRRQYKLMLPCNNFFLPNLLNLQRVSDDDLFERFYRHITIESIEPEVTTMKSLQEPKKLTVLCSDGKRRNILTKINDDLRKDRCMLNFCNLFNECYRGDVPPISTMFQVDSKYSPGEEERRWADRRRDPLSLQTFFVVPLSDSFGIIEWLPGLQSYKMIVESEYQREVGERYDRAKSEFMRSMNALSAKDNKGGRDKRIEIFNAHFEQFKPARFGDWFKTFYAEPYSWWRARKNFTRTSAAFSMLGSVLGLGDRHAENILFDTSTGDVVHVDFNSIFQQGELMMVPERVPFRLTHNMTHAMGVFGHEGMFRKTCEDVLIVCRQFRELFAVHVTILLDDPLKDWIEQTDHSNRSVYNVEARLFGIVGRSKDKKIARGKPLSVEGQVDYLIKEATNINNLGSMYHGWGAYL